MNLALPLMSFVYALIGFLVMSGLVVALCKLFGLVIPKLGYKLWLAAFAIFAWWQWSHVSGPRFVITDEAGSSPIIGGEIRAAPKRMMTNEERLEYNNRLIRENKN